MAKGIYYCKKCQKYKGSIEIITVGGAHCCRVHTDTSNRMDIKREILIYKTR